MSDLRTAAQQALEALEGDPNAMIAVAEGHWDFKRDLAITALRAALAQQAEPVESTPFDWPRKACPCRDVQHGECLTAGCKWERDPGLVPQHLRQPPTLAQQAEPLNLRDPAVQKRLATQWGYVPAAQQAEPVEPVYWEVRCAAHPKWMRVDEQQFDEYVSYGWEGQRLYTAPPQRKLVPLTEEEIDAEWRELDGEVSTMFMRVLRKFARAVEKASWEKNHG